MHSKKARRQADKTLKPQPAQSSKNADLVAKYRLGEPIDSWENRDVNRATWLALCEIADDDEARTPTAWASGQVRVRFFSDNLVGTCMLEILPGVGCGKSVWLFQKSPLGNCLEG